MAVFKCKMCGGDLSFQPGESVGTCDYCGAQQTLPKVMDENLQALFNRANVLRMKAEFDKAAEIYEKILQASGTEAEAYWGLILCKYGIEYVEDPVTFQRIPTCHRASYDAVTADDDYKMALQYADAQQRALYESQAKQIDEIQKGILALAQKEEPYDVFICYKETDENGQRTQDSVIANDIYYQLTQEGFKVFYAAITLEDKLGQEYEPFIFSALNTARVMLSLGTKPEYFNAVWVKNEWSRFLKIMKKDRARMLIPCYRDMDAYELPEEFAHLQAQDMSKIGFINDVVRGIKKVLGKDEKKATPQETVVVQQGGGSQLDALIKRGNMALEDREWEKADGFFEEVLNQDAENGEAYVGKLLAGNNCSDFASLKFHYLGKYENISESKQIEACSVADEHIKEQISKYQVPGFLNANQIEEAYYYERKFDSILDSRKEQKSKQISELKYDKLLSRAIQYAKGEYAEKLQNFMKEIEVTLDKRIAEAENADKEAVSRIVAGYKAHIEEMDKNVSAKNKEALAKKANAERKNKKIAIISFSSIVAVVAIVFLSINVIIPLVKYNKAVGLQESEKYEEAWKEFKELGDYKDSKQRRGICLEKSGKGIVFGVGPDNNPLEWVMLTSNGNEALYITEQVIDVISYHNELEAVTWENCTLRTYLNNDFIKNTFSEAETSRIKQVTLQNKDNEEYGTSGGNDTTDKIFCLSLDEVNEYFEDDEARVSIPTEYAKGKVSAEDMEYFMDGSSGGCAWWLRSPGCRDFCAASVDGSGWVNAIVNSVHSDRVGIRPALWLNLES